MKIKKQLKPKSHKLAWTIFIIACGIIGYGLFAYGSHSWPFADSNSSVERTNDGSTDATDPSNNTINSVDRPDNNPAPSSPKDKTPKKYDRPDGDSQSVSNSINATINHAAIHGDKLQIRVTIAQELNAGVCKLTLSKSGSADVTGSANIIANPASSTCAGFDVSTSQLSSGKWNITIDLTSGDLVGEAKGAVDIP